MQKLTIYTTGQLRVLVETTQKFLAKKVPGFRITQKTFRFERGVYKGPEKVQTWGQWLGMW